MKMILAHYPDRYKKHLTKLKFINTIKQQKNHTVKLRANHTMKLTHGLRGRYESDVNASKYFILPQI